LEPFLGSFDREQHEIIQLAARREARPEGAAAQPARAAQRRATAALGWRRRGVSREHIAHVLNHRSVTRATVTAIYDRYSYDREKRLALNTWARALDRSITGKAGAAKVVSLTSSRVRRELP
jgi:hypothetical protein